MGMDSMLMLYAILAPAEPAGLNVPAIDPEVLMMTVGSSFLLFAGGAFFALQRYMNDPQREQFREQWFKTFEANREERYAKDGIEWRAKDLHEHWGPGKSEGW
jgi:hypothetical protein